MKKNRSITYHSDHQTMQPPSMHTLENWICGIIGLISGCYAAINPPAFINRITLGIVNNIGEALWAIFVASLSTLTGLLIKHWYDIKGRRFMDKFLFKRKNKRRLR